MDFRDWLIVAGVVIIVGILLDGFRRMRLARKDSISMSRNMMGDMDSSAAGDDYNPELPGGGARIVSRGEVTDDVEEGYQSGVTEKIRVEPGFSSEADGAIDTQETTEVEAADFALVADSEDRVVKAEKAQAEASASNPQKVSASPSKPKQEPMTASTATSASAADNAQPSDSQEAQEVIVINVDSKPNTEFSGSDIKKLLEACGLDHGDMSIFHRHEEDDLLSPIQFSVANAVEPGYFDPEKMDALATPGVSFFMSLPGPKDYMKAFEYMLETAQCFASNLQGELKDERRSVLTPQTIEHCKQRVREFERKQLSRVRA